MASNGTRLAFYGDDFTGSTDAMESLARLGVRTLLFTSVPTPAQLRRHPDLGAFGVAGMTRSMTPDEMDRHLRPALAALRGLGAPVVHYKVCSTFDSAPHVGSIGRVIDIGLDVFAPRFVPIVVGAPALGRHCVFGNLFARCGSDSEPFRLDRHPSMSRHPVTRMDEADLRLHLAEQTRTPIELFDILKVGLPVDQAMDAFGRLATGLRRSAVLIDLLYESQLATVGAILQRHAAAGAPFIVGSSGVESALGAHWFGEQPPARPTLPAATPSSPIIVACGSCSPVTARQIERAVQRGFAEISVRFGDDADRVIHDTGARATAALRNGSSVVIHSGGGSPSAGVSGDARSAIGPILGQSLRQVLADNPSVRRIAIAGGDTSGSVARALDIESLEVVAELARGAPLCRATAPGSPADGIEVTFKGGQIGAPDFFALVQDGGTEHPAVRKENHE